MDGKTRVVDKLREVMSDCPCATGMAVYVLVSFVAVCLYWQFGANSWIKIGLAPGWMLSVVGAMQIALAIDLRR